ncbi:hypothetical protein [Streptomyces sulphureus]|uniref:hypothetical protein n=1 Tax=Streptomyces sulphureus TaxID=47758 RepID=UPI0003648E2A|nr:hypothetical protein [Streptomyces sulphureus]
MTTDQKTKPADQTEALPPYSGEETPCPKCRYPEAYTLYRSATQAVLDEFNGRLQRRGPLPERLERQCQRCDYAWDEALVPDGADADEAGL